MTSQQYRDELDWCKDAVLEVEKTHNAVLDAAMYQGGQDTDWSLVHKADAWKQASIRAVRSYRTRLAHWFHGRLIGAQKPIF